VLHNSACEDFIIKMPPRKRAPITPNKENENVVDKCATCKRTRCTFCNLCDRHCSPSCPGRRSREADQLRTPRPARKSRDETVAAVRESLRLLEKTPQVLRKRDEDMNPPKDLDDLFGIFPPSEEVRMSMPPEEKLSAKNADTFLRGLDYKLFEKSVVKYALDIAEICASLISKNAKSFILEHVGKFLNKRQGTGAEAALKKTTTNRKKDQLVSDMTGILEKLPKHEEQYRVIRALLVHAFPKEELDRGLKENGGKVSFSKVARATAYRDFETLNKGESIKRTKRTCSRVSETIRSAVEFLLSQENVGALSWGSKTVNVSGNRREFPCLTLKRGVQTIWKSYDKACKIADLQREQRLGRSTIYKLAKMLTAGEERLVTSVDYVTGVLVNDTVQMLQRVISELCPKESVAELTKFLGLCRNFLKVQYDFHIMSDDDDIDTHGRLFALSLPSLFPNTGDKKTGCCNACRFCRFFICKALPEAVKKTRTTVSDDLVKDALLYIGHASEKWQL
jgi:hypothetical protein